MKVYIIYTEYNNQEYDLLNIGRLETAAEYLFTKVYMEEFKEANDDDRINLYLAEADISREDFRILTDNIDEDEVSNILQKIDLGPDTRIIYTVNGGDF
jgi:16S rRNA C967 or C1407 C5-methylase (RsmB/RsmF family)